VGQVAATLAPEKLRAWIRDPLTPTERLNLYAFLLGACGGEDDARLLEAMIQKPTERNVVALGGILAGYVKMRPREGWDLCFTICRDPERPFLERLGAMRTMRFYHGWKPESSRREVLRCLDVLVAQGDMADLAFEDLRRWKYWELTGKVLAQWGKESHNAPILKRSLVRYALCCPQPEATKFIDQLKAGKDTRDMVQEVEESLQFEKQPK
jgi:hypothetical protein